MTRLPPPPPPAALRAPAPPAAPSNGSGAIKTFGIIEPRRAGAQRVLLYGEGSVGKTSLGALAPNPVFIDFEGRAGELGGRCVSGVDDWSDLRAALLSLETGEHQTVVIDSVTKAEELCAAYTVAMVPNDKGNRVASLTAYGFNKGLEHNFNTFLPFLQDCDRLVRAGKNVILIAHACTDRAPNPNGEDWIRYEPRLQAPQSGKNSIRERVFEWADHVLFLSYDVVVSDEGKGRGVGTRTIYPVQLPSHRAKSLRASQPVPYAKGDGSIWTTILGGAQ